VKRTWKPIVAGIINLVVGIFTLLGTFIIASIIVGVSGGVLAISRIYELTPIWLSEFLQGFSIIIAILLIIVSILPIAGGAYSLQRKNWNWALAGSIIAILSSAVLGIVSTLLVALSKNEFEKYDRFR
jgi:hypothetical protein